MTLPLLLPFLAGPACRVLVASLPPGRAAWLPAGSAASSSPRGCCAPCPRRNAAALAARTSPARCRPGFALAATTGPVPLRVAALLGRPAGTRTRSAHRRLAAVTLPACLAVSAGASLQAADDLHTGIERAQGEIAGK
ncbi:hypothetical protein [Streptomyces sp. NPDC059564]|uniref:hypothetical protein n=1 Tax=Streptomyces sp. NPDC059564 TaxID=3346865 RepID=UPI00369B59EF